MSYLHLTLSACGTSGPEGKDATELDSKVRGSRRTAFVVHGSMSCLELGTGTYITPFQPQSNIARSAGPPGWLGSLCTAQRLLLRTVSHLVPHLGSRHGSYALGYLAPSKMGISIVVKCM